MCYYKFGDDMKDNNLVKRVIKFILAFLIFFSSIYIQKFLLVILHLKRSQVTTSLSTILNCVSSIIILFLLFLLYRKDLIKEFKIFKDNLSNNIDIGFKYWIIGLIGMMISNIIISLLLNGGGADNEQLVQQMIKTSPLLMIINAGVIAPLNEEILFRKNFRNLFSKNIIFILLSGIIFGYMHVSSSTNLLQFAYIIPYSSLGICFAIAYCKTNTVFTSICMHAMHNTILTLISILL